MGDLFVISRANIFAIYPKILENILNAENLKRNREGALKKDYVNLPTDSDYQERVYYRLLAVQKSINDLLDSGVLVLCEIRIDHPVIFLSFSLEHLKKSKPRRIEPFGIQQVNSQYPHYLHQRLGFH